MTSLDSGAPGRPESQISFRLRLTIWTIGVVLLVQTAILCVTVLYQRDSIRSLFDDQLLERAQTLAARVSERLTETEGSMLRALDPGLLRSESLPGMYCGVYQTDGSPLVQRWHPDADPARDVLISPPFPEEDAAYLQEALRLTSEAEPVSIRVIVLPFEAGDGETYILAFGAADGQTSQMLMILVRILVVAMLAGVVSAGVAGWIVAGVAVSPIRAATRAVEGLSTETLREDVDLGGTSMEVRRLEDELDEARRRIEQAFRAQGRFISNVSHELKTPVAVLLTESEVLDLKDSSDEIRDFVQSVRAEMAQLGKLIESFLLLTRIREAKTDIDSSRHLVNEIVMDACERSAQFAEQNMVRMDPTLLSQEEWIDTEIVGAAPLLRSMLDNLIRNAIRFSPKESAVRIVVDREDEQVLIHVRDRGPGIPEDLIDEIFDRFAQAPDEHRRGRGHGLGLEIAQGIAELHGGHITVRNLDGSGCEFTVTLPVAPLKRASSSA